MCAGLALSDRFVLAWLDQFSAPLPAPRSLLGSALIMLVGGSQTDEDFGSGFKERLRFRLVELVEIFVDMFDQLIEFFR